MIDGLVFGLYVLVVLAAAALLLAELASRVARRLGVFQSRNFFLVVIAALAALQGVVALAWPLASMLALWAVSTQAHVTGGGFVFEQLKIHGVGIFIGVVAVFAAALVVGWISKRRPRPAPVDREEEIIFGR